MDAQMRRIMDALKTHRMRNEGSMKLWMLVKKGTKFSILFGLLGQSLLTGLVAGYITYFGTDIVGVSALAMGIFC